MSGLEFPFIDTIVLKWWAKGKNISIKGTIEEEVVKIIELVTSKDATIEGNTIDYTTIKAEGESDGGGGAKLPWCLHHPLLGVGCELAHIPKKIIIKLS